MTVIVYIDGQNIHSKHAESIVKSLRYKNVYFKVYLHTDDILNNRDTKWMEKCKRLNMELITINTIEYDVSLRMTCDIMRDNEEDEHIENYLEHIVIASNRISFEPVIRTIRKYGKKVVGLFTNYNVTNIKHVYNNYHDLTPQKRFSNTHVNVYKNRKRKNARKKSYRKKHVHKFTQYDSSDINDKSESKYYDTLVKNIFSKLKKDTSSQPPPLIDASSDSEEIPLKEVKNNNIISQPLTSEQLLSYIESSSDKNENIDSDKIPVKYTVIENVEEKKSTDVKKMKPSENMEEKENVILSHVSESSDYSDFVSDHSFDGFERYLKSETKKDIKPKKVIKNKDDSSIHSDNSSIPSDDMFSSRVDKTENENKPSNYSPLDPLPVSKTVKVPDMLWNNTF